MENLVFAVKTEVVDLRAKTLTFANQKTMYGGKCIAAGDTIFVFASENEGGSGLFHFGWTQETPNMVRAIGFRHRGFSSLKHACL